MKPEEELAALEARVRDRWFAAMSAALHGIGCGCCGGSAVRLDGAMVTEGIAHALTLRYAAGGDPALAAIVTRRFEDVADPMTGLRAVAEIDPERAIGVAHDILASLNSIGGGAAAFTSGAAIPNQA